MKDPQHQLLIQKVTQGSFAKSQAEEEPAIREYFNMRNRLTIIDDLLVYNFHGAHQGTDSILSRVRRSDYWPAIDKAVEESCKRCDTCLTMMPSQHKKQLICTPPPDYPFQRVVMDLFSKDSVLYLAYACRLTGWLEISYFLGSCTSSDVINLVREFFSEKISTDGEPNLDSKAVLSFLSNWGVRRRLSSAYYPQSNGRAEAAVKTAKRIISDNTGTKGNIYTDKIARALLLYRNTPIKGTDTSPAQLLLGRNLRDLVPQPSGYKISNKWQYFLRKREEAMAKNSDRYTNATSNRLSLYELPIGTEVLCQNTKTNEWNKGGLIVESCGYRSYKVKLHGSGMITLRNRIHLRPVLIFKSPVTVSKSQPDPEHDSGPRTAISTTNQTQVPSHDNQPTQLPSSNGLPEYQPDPPRRSQRQNFAPNRYGEWIQFFNLIYSAQLKKNVYNINKIKHTHNPSK